MKLISIREADALQQFHIARVSAKRIHLRIDLYKIDPHVVGLKSGVEPFERGVGLPEGRKLDAALFDAYNRCDLEKFGSLVSENVGFYHDQAGLKVGKAALTDSVKKYACGICELGTRGRTVHVYRMEGFGALEMGVRRFHEKTQAGTESVEEGKFICLWQSKGGAWKVTRIIIYDYHSVEK
jgi:hypothetical protein